MPKERVAGKIVLVGTSATGLTDSHPTPLDPVYPGVEVHATIIENIVNGHFLARPLWASGFEFAAVVVLGCLSTFFLARASALFSVCFFVLGGCGIWYGSFILLEKQGIFINPLCGVLMLVVNFACLGMLQLWQQAAKSKGDEPISMPG